MPNAPIQQPINQGGVVNQVWGLFFVAVAKLLSNSQPWQLPSYTVAEVPEASLYRGHVIYISNESGGAVIAFSDGSNWRRVTDRAVIS